MPLARARARLKTAERAAIVAQAQQEKGSPPPSGRAAQCSRPSKRAISRCGTSFNHKRMVACSISVVLVIERATESNCLREKMMRVEG